jgi:hypothetical protein
VGIVCGIAGLILIGLLLCCWCGWIRRFRKSNFGRKCLPSRRKKGEKAAKEIDEVRSHSPEGEVQKTQPPSQYNAAVQAGIVQG